MKILLGYLLDTKQNVHFVDFFKEQENNDCYAKFALKRFQTLFDEQGITIRNPTYNRMNNIIYPNDLGFKEVFIREYYERIMDQNRYYYLNLEQ